MKLAMLNVHRGWKEKFVTTLFDLMEIRAKNLPQNLDLELRDQNCSSSHCILLVVKMKLFQGTTGRKPNSSLEKWQKRFLDGLTPRSNSGFTVLNAWI